MNLLKVWKDLHQIPEIAYSETKTQAYLMNKLDEIGLKYKKTVTTGLIVIWNGASRNVPYKLFRADIDALPVREETGVEFCSKHPGFMHACGHDVHSTILLGLAEKVKQNNLETNAIFLFQPAEEGGGGAEMALEDLVEYNISEAWALHVTDEYEVGIVATKPGLLFASSFEINSVFTGRSSHVAFYNQGRDAIAGAIKLVDDLYSKPQKGFVARFGKIEGGSVRNAVPDKCSLFGTVRTESFKKTEELVGKINDTGKRIALENGLEYNQTTGSKYPEVIVDEGLFNKLSCKVKVDLAEMKFTGEDFGFISLKYPSLLFWLGCRTPGKPQVGLHNPGFLPDESTIEKGLNVFYKLLTSE
ncbi:MAG: amidohydrolase [Candidatus Riflebacteria bacterium]|nr:amidohydrolase [Candidatus Riflebacteria bacterium]